MIPFYLFLTSIFSILFKYPLTRTTMLYSSAAVLCSCSLYLSWRNVECYYCQVFCWIFRWICKKQWGQTVIPFYLFLTSIFSILFKYPLTRRTLLYSSAAVLPSCSLYLSWRNVECYYCQVFCWIFRWICKKQWGQTMIPFFPCVGSSAFPWDLQNARLQSHRPTLLQCKANPQYGMSRPHHYQYCHQLSCKWGARSQISRHRDNNFL